MPSVLDRSALEQSPLADLHLLANELGVDGFRRLRKPELVDAILARQGGAAEAEADAVPGPEREPESAAAPEPEREPESAAGVESDEPKRSRRGRRGGRGRRRDEDDGGVVEREEETPVASADDRDGKSVEGVVELLANGSGFLRLSPPEETEGDVYISAAQVKRCELVSGDKISGPVRGARRSERFPSLIRVETINGRPAEEVAEGTRFEDLPVAWPDERISLGSDDPTVRAIEWLTPFGKGSRVVITGASRSGKSEALRRIASALGGASGLEVSAVLTGVRPEEAVDFPVAPSSVLSFAASSDAQAQAVEQAVETGRRVAARGGDAVVLIDGFEYLPTHAARRALAAGRNLKGGGSLTVIATAPVPVGGETTVVALDRGLATIGTFPALSLAESGTLRPELLVGEAGAAALRAAAAGGELPPAPEPVAEPEREAELEPEIEPTVEVQESPLAVADLVAEPEIEVPAARAPRAKRKPAAAKKAAGAKAKPAARSTAAKKRAAGAKKTAATKPAATAKKKPAATKKPAAKTRAASKKPSAK